MFFDVEFSILKGKLVITRILRKIQFLSHLFLIFISLNLVDLTCFASMNGL